MLSRRRLLAVGGQLAAAGLLARCGIGVPGDGRGGDAVLRARPGSTSPRSLPEPPTGPGTHPLGLRTVRDTLLHVPPGIGAGQAVPLVVMLHGAGGDASGGLAPLQSLADERGLVLLAPASRGATWDAIGDDYGPDVRLLGRALRKAFAAVPVDPARVAVAGFSDGASYALGLGLANGRLFSRVVAFSPGFVPLAARAGHPRVFVAHGTADTVLTIGKTSRRIVPDLRKDGLAVTYREFAGPHAVPPDVARQAADWLGWNRPG